MVAFQSLKDYGPTFQIKVISSLLKNKAFLLNVRDIIDESHFEHPGIKQTLTETIKYFDKYHCCPTLDTLKIEVKKTTGTKCPRCWKILETNCVRCEEAESTKNK